MRFKVWVQIEQLDDEEDEYEDVRGPICVADTRYFEEAEDILMAIVLMRGEGMDQQEIARWFAQRAGGETAGCAICSRADESLDENGYCSGCAADVMDDAK